MKHPAGSHAVFAFLFCFQIVACSLQQTPSSDSGPDGTSLEGAYLGQESPGLTPTLFAPGVICSRYQSHSGPAFAPDGQSVYWSMWLEPFPTEVILFMELVEGEWIAPEVAPFSGLHSDGQPFFSPNGDRLFFNSRRPLVEGGEPPPSRRTWVMERQGVGWGPPEPFVPGGHEVEAITAMGPDGKVYFTSSGGPDRNNDIFVISMEDGEYGDPVALSENVNSPYSEFVPTISPDGGILVFATFQRPDGFAFSEIFVSFLQPDGSWSRARNLGEEVNRGSTRFPHFSPDGEYLFFTSDLTLYPEVTERWTLERILETNAGSCAGTENVYWVDASFLDNLRPD